MSWSRYRIIDPCMLYEAGIRVQQFGADRTDMLQRCLPCHPGQPGILHCLHVIIEQQDILAFRLLHANVAHMGKIKLHRHVKILERKILPEVFQPDTHPCRASVVHYHNLKTGVVRMFID